MRRAEQDQVNYGVNPQHTSDFDDEGLETRSHRINTQGYSDSYDSKRRSDVRIREDVCEKLFAHLKIDPSLLKVVVEEGMVILSGTIESSGLKTELETEIKTLLGVTGIQNDLKIEKGP